MDWFNSIDLDQWIVIGLFFFAVGLLIALLLIIVIVSRVRRIQLPPDADPITDPARHAFAGRDRS